MKSKKDKIIVALTGVALTVVFLVALIIGDTAGIEMDDGTQKPSKYADDNGTSEGESTNNEEESTKDEEKPTVEEPSTEEPSTEEPTTEPEKETVMFLVNLSDFVYVRAQASTDGEILGKVYAGGGGEVIEESGDWTKIKSGPVEGYVFSEYIWTGKEAEDNLKIYGTKIGTITTTDLRIRDAAGTDSDVLGYFDINAEVTIVEVGDTWHKIQYNGEDAYIAAEYVDIRYEYGEGVTAEEEAAAIKAEEERLAAALKAEEQKKAGREAILDAAVANFDFSDIVISTHYTKPISNEEIYLMMCVVSKECGYDVYEGQLAVANLILNRWNGGNNGSIRNILEDPGKFDVVTWDIFWEEVKKGPMQSSINAVKAALSGVNNVPRFTNYISLTGITDADYAIMKEYEVIGNQVFYSRK